MINLKNIKNSPITTVVGAIVILASVASVFVFNRSWTEAGIGMTVGVTLMMMSDKAKGGNAGVILIVATVLLASCSRKITPVTSTHEKKDSTNVTTSIKYRDTLIYSPVDSASIKAMVHCPENGMLQLAPRSHRSRNSIVTVGIVNNQLLAECLCDSIELRLQVAEKQTTIYRSAMESLKQTNVVMVKFVPKWIKAFAWTGAGCLSLIIAYLIWKLIRMYFKIV